MPRKSDQAAPDRAGGARPGRHERAVGSQILSWRRQGQLPPNREHLVTALRAAARALDAAEQQPNHYGTRQAIVSLQEVHAALFAGVQVEESVEDWLARMPTKPERGLS
jgi:hypothetical protein